MFTCPVCGSDNVKTIGEYSLFPHSKNLFLWRPETVACFHCKHKWELSMEEEEAVAGMIEAIEDKVYQG